MAAIAQYSHQKMKKNIQLNIKKVVLLRISNLNEDEKK